MTNAETYESWNVAPARERNRSGDNDENDAGSPSVEAFDDLASAGIAIVRNTTTETHSGAISFGWRRDEAGKIIGRIAREKTFTVEDEVTTDFSVKISVTGISSLGDGIRYHLVRVDEGAATIVLDTNSASLRRLVRISDDSIQFTAWDLQPGTYRLVVANISGKGTFGAVNVDLIFENTHHFAGSAEKALGNMLADDRLGSHLTKFCLINKEGACQEPGPGGMELQGDYGLLTIQAGGDYAYVPRRDLRAIGRTDTFDYELHHPNGEVAEASLTIRIGEAPFHGGVETDTVPVEDQTLLPSAPQETTVSDPLAHLARPTEDDLAPISSDV